MNFAQKQLIMGFRTIILGIVLLVLELMFLPVFGLMQKSQVSGDGFYTAFIDYAKMQPMPLIFMMTAVIIILGIIFMVRGYLAEKRS